MAEPFLGQINIFPYTFAPRGWAFCQGQLLSIAQNTALFSLLGTTFGGNGQTTFALPDMRSRLAIGPGQGPGLSSYDLGEQAGSESVTMTIETMAAHMHPVTFNVNNSEGGTTNPENAYLGKADPGPYAAAQNANGGAQPATGPTGGQQPFTIIEPYLALNFCIATEGVYPSRN